MNTNAATRRSLLLSGLAAATVSLRAADRQKPNILLLISDDQSWLHTGAAGHFAVQTPGFDRVAREGAGFSHAFCAAPSCAPSRASILTGMPIWQLEEAANMRAHLPTKFPTYTKLLAAAGYKLGLRGKGYGPVEAGTPGDNPAGAAFRDFRSFLAGLSDSQPFCYLHGSARPHRPYAPDAWRQAATRLKSIQVPGFLPDVPEVRQDLLNYLLAIEEFDREVRDTLEALEQSGRAANTLVVITSDNGMSFPRAKCNLYDHGTRMPLAVRWPGRIPGGRTIDDPVSLSQLAATFLDAAGVPGLDRADSLMPLLLSTRGGVVNPQHDAVYFARERHTPSRPGALGYPMRAIRTNRYLYIRNLAPERWPAGDPAGSSDVDASPTLDFMKRNRERIGRLFDLSFARRPAEELYDVAADPEQLHNAAAEKRYAATRLELSRRLDAHLRQTRDPRALGDGEQFDRYPFWGPSGR